jgi:uncharacterized integral membrane protein (TIGR00697 family)
MIYLSVIYVCTVLISNILSNQIINLGFITDAGTLVFPLIFTIRDYMHIKDKEMTKKISNLTIVINIVFSLLVFIILKLEVVGDNNLKGINSTFLIVLASCIAFYISQKVDYAIFEKTKSIFKSNLVSIFVDTILFSIVAFFQLNPKIIISIFISNLVIKYIITILHILFLKGIKNDICIPK